MEQWAGHRAVGRSFQTKGVAGSRPPSPGSAYRWASDERYKGARLAASRGEGGSLAGPCARTPATARHDGAPAASASGPGVTEFHVHSVKNSKCSKRRGPVLDRRWTPGWPLAPAEQHIPGCQCLGNGVEPRAILPLPRTTESRSPAWMSETCRKRTLLL
jgi:hypothetical protein